MVNKTTANRRITPPTPDIVSPSVSFKRLLNMFMIFSAFANNTDYQPYHDCRQRKSCQAISKGQHRTFIHFRSLPYVNQAHLSENQRRIQEGGGIAGAAHIYKVQFRHIQLHRLDKFPNVSIMTSEKNTSSKTKYPPGLTTRSASRTSASLSG